MMKNTKLTTLITAAVAAAALAAGTVPAAFADNSASDSASAIVAERSFPKVNTVKANLYAEATSTDVDDDSNWGGVESLDVPHTKSTAEKEAEAAAQAAAEEAARQAQEEAAAASRSQSRESISDSSSESSSNETSSGSSNAGTAAAATVAAGSATAANIAAFAQNYVGYPYVSGGNTPAGWDCSGFVQWVFSQFGISLPRTSGAQAAVGTAVPSLAAAQPGDIIANSGHAAIYIGNGLCINALNPAQGTQITAVNAVSSFAGGYNIRRVI